MALSGSSMGRGRGTGGCTGTCFSNKKTLRFLGKGSWCEGQISSGWVAPKERRRDAFDRVGVPAGSWTLRYAVGAAMGVAAHDLVVAA